MSINLTEIEIQILSKLEEGLKLEPQPYKRLAQELGINEDEIIIIIKKLIELQYIRRLGLSVNPTSSGYGCNVLVVWSVPESKVEEIGNKLAEYNEVSHCYERATPDEWHGNLFTMVHTKDEEKFEEFLLNVQKELGIKPYKVLKTLKELKKTKPKYIKR